MEVRIYSDYEALSLQAANELAASIRLKPESVLCLAAGDTPRKAYSLLAKAAGGGQVDAGKCTFIGLDEWVGIAPGNDGSCHYFLRKVLFEPMKTASARIRLFDSIAKDLQSECKSMDEFISEKGGIDCMVVGIGMNGHIGFNEPGTPFDRYCHVATLDQSTRSVGQKYFRQETSLKKGITVGLGHLMQAKKVILIANGVKKAEVVRKALEEAVSPGLPASIVRKHPDALVMLDREAASALTGQPDRSASA